MFVVYCGVVCSSSIYPVEEEYEALGSRISACEQFLQSLIQAEFDNYPKGEWAGIVRAKIRDLESAGSSAMAS